MAEPMIERKRPRLMRIPNNILRVWVVGTQNWIVTGWLAGFFTGSYLLIPAVNFFEKNMSP
jgi:hypothetical protein